MQNKYVYDMIKHKKAIFHSHLYSGIWHNDYLRNNCYLTSQVSFVSSSSMKL